MNITSPQEAGGDVDSVIEDDADGRLAPVARLGLEAVRFVIDTSVRAPTASTYFTHAGASAAFVATHAVTCGGGDAKHQLRFGGGCPRA